MTVDPDDTPHPGSAEPTQQPPFPADWDRYRVEALLGRGGMGEVYRAYDLHLGRHVALKFLHQFDPTQAERFQQEARTQARVDHPNVCTVYEVGEVEGRPYIAMEYVDGVTLDEAADRLALRAKIGLIRTVAEAVHAAHRTGLIHRDLKPGNIMVAESDDGSLTPFVLDFGIARDMEAHGLTVTGTVTGTPAYISPEQAAGDIRALDRTADVYSLGVVLYELITGTVPFVANNPVETLVKVMSDEPRSMRRVDREVPADLDTIVLKCLAKEPSRRYPSALALADDLNRYLEGEPIVARPPSAGYLLGKWVRRNRTVAAAIVVATVAVIASGGVVLRSRWRASEQARVAQGFGADVQEIEAILRFAALLPRQDTTPYRQMVDDRMERIRVEKDRLGRVAQGPGLYALGRGAEALAAYEQARGHLERALAVGYDGPAVHAALGRVLGQLYRAAGLDAQGIADRELREASWQRIREEYLEPALDHFRKCTGADGEIGSYEAGLIAFYEERYDDAVAAARAAFEQRPWLYEVKLLEGDIALTRGDKARESGDVDKATAFFEEAGEAYAAVLEIARSDASAYTAECQRQAYLLEQKQWQRDPIGGEAGEALAMCDAAIEVDPAHADAYGTVAQVHVILARDRMVRGLDPIASLRLAAGACEQALTLSPNEPGVLSLLGMAHDLEGRWEMSRGRDPVPALTRAAEELEKAVELSASLPGPHNRLGSVLYNTALYEATRGRDPTPAAEAAIASYTRAIELVPSFAKAYTNRGATLVLVAEHVLARGQDPRDTLARAIDSLDRAIELDPHTAASHNNRATALLTLADSEIARGGDPTQALDGAVDSLTRVLEATPGYFIGAYNLALAHYYQALHLVRQGDDPSHAVARAVHGMEAARRLNPADADVDMVVGETELVAVRWALARDHDPRPALRRARAAATHGLGINPSAVRLYEVRAKAGRWEAEWVVARGGDPSAIIDAGRSAVRRALELKPDRGEAWATAGALDLVAAQVEKDPTRRQGIEAAARDQLRRALELNPLLATEHAALLERLSIEVSTAGQ